MKLNPIAPLTKEQSRKGLSQDQSGAQSDSQLELTTQSVTQSTTQSDNQLLLLLKNNPLSSGELMAKLGLKHRANFREKHLHPALKEGYIEQTIPKKPSSRLQKYRLTQKGLNLLTNPPNHYPLK